MADQKRRRTPDLRAQGVMDPHEIEKRVKASIPPVRLFDVIVRVPNRLGYEVEHVCVEAHAYADTAAGSLMFQTWDYDPRSLDVVMHYKQMFATGQWLSVREITDVFVTKQVN